MKTRREWAMEPMYSTLGGDPDLSDLVTLFVEEMPDRVANILDLLEHYEWEELRRAAHQIKGAAGSYGFGAISPCAGKLEFAIRDQEPERPGKHVQSNPRRYAARGVIGHSALIAIQAPAVFIGGYILIFPSAAFDQFAF